MLQNMEQVIKKKMEEGRIVYRKGGWVYQLPPTSGDKKPEHVMFPYKND